METEKYITGYCRQLDASRIVEVILENGKVTEVDCSFGHCPYEQNCPIGREIAQL